MSSKDSDDDKSIEDLQKIKLKAEIVKIQEETLQIKKPWYAQPTFLSVLASISVPVLTLLLAYFFGGGKEYFDAQKLNLEYDKKILINQVENFRKDTIGLNKKYSEASKKLLKDHIKDSIELDSKLFDATSKLSSNQALLKTVKSQLKSSIEKLNYDKIAYSTETIINQFISEGGLWSSIGRQKFNDLVIHIKQIKQRDLITSYFDTLTNNSKIPIITKCTISELFYFATKEDHWKKKLFAIIDNAIISEINTDKNVRSFKVESFLTLLHSDYWSKTELHENNKFIIRKVMTVFPSYRGDFERLNDLLMGTIDQDYEYAFNSFKINLNDFDSINKKYLYFKLCDTLMEPSYDHDGFINLLIACRMFWNKNTLKVYEGNYNLNEKFENIFKAFLSEKIFSLNNIEDRYALMTSYDEFTHPDFSLIFNPKGKKEVMVPDKNALQVEIDSLAKWKKVNSSLCERLREKNMQTYRNNINLLVRDSKYEKNRLRN